MNTLHQSASQGRHFTASLMTSVTNGGLRDFVASLRNTTHALLDQNRFHVRKTSGTYVRNDSEAGILFVLGESHFAILARRELPETSVKLTVDFYTCRGPKDGEDVIQAIIAKFGPPLPGSVSDKVVTVDQLHAEPRHLRDPQSDSEGPSLLTATFYGVEERLFDDGKQAKRKLVEELERQPATRVIRTIFDNEFGGPGYTFLILGEVRGTLFIVTAHTYIEFGSICLTFGSLDNVFAASINRVAYRRFERDHRPLRVQFANHSEQGIPELAVA